jgi:glycosyltransferase involved in cell wall biosynthesis
MASGSPVVGLMDGGVAELIVDGVTGLLASPGHLHELTAAIDQLLADPERRRTLGVQARERIATQLNPEAAATQFELYNSPPPFRRNSPPMRRIRTGCAGLR